MAEPPPTHTPPPEADGAGPAAWLAVGLGAVTGGIVGLVFVAWLWMLASAGGLTLDGNGLLAAAGWGGIFWVALTVGLLGGFVLAYRAWHVASALAARRADARARREAVEAAEALLRGVPAERDDLHR